MPPEGAPAAFFRKRYLNCMRPIKTTIGQKNDQYGMYNRQFIVFRGERYIIVISQN